MGEIEEGGRDTPVSGDTHRDVILALACAVAAVMVAGVPLLWEPRFFYTDDYQTFFMPMFHEVARLLGEGELPLITDRLWRGGAILAEYQVAVLNPVSVALYLLMSKISSTPAAAAVYSLFHIAVFAAGTYFMCRALRCKPSLAVMAALTAAMSEWLLYWGAINWIPALVSMAWIPWAIGSLVRLFDSLRWFVPAAFGVALVALSGWPFALLAFAITVAVVSLLTLPWQVNGNLRRCLPVYMALLAGGLLSAPAVLPMFPYVRYSERPIDSGLLWRTSIAALTAVGMPFYRTSWFAFDKVRIVALPMTYVAWFIPVVLANAGVRRMLRTPAEGVVLVVAVWLACMSMLPLIGHFRWMFRLLPYYHFALIVLTALVLSRCGEPLRFRLVPTAVALLGPFAIALLAVPSMAMLYVASLSLVALLVISGAVLLKVSPKSLIAFALISNVLIGWTVNYNFVSSGFPIYPNAFKSPFSNDEADEAASPRRHLALYAELGTEQDETDWRTFLPGNSVLFSGNISINGYSPFFAKSFRSDFCFNYLSALTCADIVSRLTRPVEGFGVSLLDLTRTEIVNIQSPDMAEQFRRAASGSWRSSENPSGTTLFSREIDAAGPAEPISWTSQGLGTEVLAQSPRRIVVDVVNDAGGEASLVMARAWYPDWRARLNGVDLPVDAVRGLLVRVKLPAGARGQLVVEYWPGGLSAGLWMAAAGAIIVFASLLVPRAGWRRRHGTDARRSESVLQS